MFCLKLYYYNFIHLSITFWEIKRIDFLEHKKAQYKCIMPLHFCKEDNFLSALFFGGVWVRVLLGRLRSLGAVAFPWRWLRTRQFLLFSFWRVPARSWGDSAHVKSCFFLFGVCLLSLGAAPHTSILAFFFLACACSLWGRLRTRQFLLFSFWRVPAFPWGGYAHVKSCFFLFGVCLRSLEGGSAHANSCFFLFGVYLRSLGGGSAHVNSCFFLFGVYLLSLGVAPHTSILAFPFLACACSLLGVAPHTSILAFFFLTCACSLLGQLRTR